MDEWIVDVISFQKIFGLSGLKCYIVEIWRDVTLVDGRRRTTECEDRARILETEFAISDTLPLMLAVVMNFIQWPLSEVLKAKSTLGSILSKRRAKDSKHRFSLRAFLG